MSRFSLLVILVFIQTFICNHSSLTLPADVLLLGENHKNAGIDCEACHKENPPKAKASATACISCHGDYPKMGEKTRKVNPNPHETHMEHLACTNCHHAHKPSEDYCGECHFFKLKVP